METITETDERESNEYSDNDEEKSLLTDGHNSVKVYRKRWLMLLIVAVNGFIIGFTSVGLVSINNIASHYYDVTSFHIMLPQIVSLVLILILAFPTSYMLSNYGTRPVLVSAALMQVFSMMLQCFTFTKAMYWLEMLSQILTSFAFPVMSEIPGYLSAMWFPEKERALSTSIAVSQFFFGTAVGFVYPTLLVKYSDSQSTVMAELETCYISQLGVSIIGLIMAFFYCEKPPTSPCKSDNFTPKDEGRILHNLRTLCKGSHFMMLAQSVGISIGLLNTAPTIANPLITSKYHHGYESGIGWTVFAATIVGVFTSACTGYLLGKWHIYRLAGFLSDAFTSLIWLAFLLVFMYTDQWYVTCVLLVVYAATNQPKMAIGIEQAAHMTYPIPVHTSTAILVVFSTLYTFGFSTIFGILLQRRYIKTVGWSIFGLYLLATILAALTKTKNKRDNEELNE